MGDAPLLAGLRQIPTSTWSDALDEFAIQGVICGLAQRSGRGRFAGRAITARATAGPLGSYPRSAFAIAELIGGLRPGGVLALTVAGAEVSAFGGLAALAAKRQGAAAVIIDGACRDLDEIRATELWVASRSVTPVTGKTRISFEAIGEPIRLAGVTVRPDDLIVGDDTGILVVPTERLAEVSARAEALFHKDLEMTKLLNSGIPFAKAATTVGYL